MKHIILITMFLLASGNKESIVPERFSSLIDKVPPVFEVHYPQGQESRNWPINQLEVTANENEALINISSEVGIGSGRVKLVGGSWPETVIVRLHLRGLEGFAVSNGEATIRKSDFSVRAFDRNGNLINKEYLQGENGYFEVKLPSSLFVGEVTEITIHWVDFYRE